MRIEKGRWRVAVLGWGNLVIGALIPLSAGINVLAAMRVFRVAWAGESIFLTAFLGAVLGSLHWVSGRNILKERAGAFVWSCVAGGLTFGYTVLGIHVMATSGRDRSLLILIRHGSEDWWDWSLSHFQNSALREIPVLAWWVLGFGTLIRYRLLGASERLRDRAVEGLCFGVFFGAIGAILRLYHLFMDTMLVSQR